MMVQIVNSEFNNTLLSGIDSDILTIDALQIKKKVCDMYHSQLNNSNCIKNIVIMEDGDNP